ncbi:unnamed protein product [Urochloa humidicola]
MAFMLSSVRSRREVQYYPISLLLPHRAQLAAAPDRGGGGSGLACLLRLLRVSDSGRTPASTGNKCARPQLHLLWLQNCLQALDPHTEDVLKVLQVLEVILQMLPTCCWFAEYAL